MTYERRGVRTALLADLRIEWRSCLRCGRGWFTDKYKRICPACHRATNRQAGRAAVRVGAGVTPPPAEEPEA